ncbi:MAG: excinuclease ABC subunit UvrC [Chloroflexi bacterium]|nr:excinuclease ABC subunit UvrC [Chloroflexota bacterium]
MVQALAGERVPLEEQLAHLPDEPGVYKFSDARGSLLYVGKAKSLKNRVRSYFQKPDTLDPVKRQMVTEIADVQYLLAETPAQALVWEADLVRSERPRYNVKLRDDKHYPYIRINVQDPWPKTMVARRAPRDGARYFGPFTDASSVRQTLDTVNRLFPHILCTRIITGTDPRACLYYHIKRCPAPCIGAIDNEGYRQIIDQMVGFLDGKSDAVLATMRRDMEDAADRLEFERAADLRDRIRAAEKVVTQQQVLYTGLADQDVVGLYRDGSVSCVQVLLVRSGRLTGREHFVLEGTGQEADGEILGSFLSQFYGQASDVPEELVLPALPEDADVLRTWLSERRAELSGLHRLRLTVPVQGEKRRLVELAGENAREALEQLQQQWLADVDRTTGAVVELQELLNLPQIPNRIECYDISHVQGTNQVASMVVFDNGQPRRSAYRRFKIKHSEGNNDYLSMQEVIGRRFRRALTGQVRRRGEEGSWDEVDEPADGEEETAAEAAWAEMPDLVIIDGGKGQLNAALEVLDGMDITELPVVGLAKENEELFVRDRATGRAGAEPTVLPRTSQALYLVQRIRDEAHRFAITYHRQVRSRGGLRSALDEIQGIGPKRKRELLRRFGSVRGIRSASLEDLAAVPGMTLKQAKAVKANL